MPKYGYKFVFCNASDHCLALIKLEIPDNAKIIRPRIAESYPIQESRKCRTNICRFIDVVAYFQYSICYPDSLSRWLRDWGDWGGIFVINSIKNETPKNKLTFASIYDPASFIYKINGYNIENLLDLDINEQCAEGIHFFETKNEAILWIQHEVNGGWIDKKYKAFAKTYNIK